MLAQELNLVRTRLSVVAHEAAADARRRVARAAVGALHVAEVACGARVGHLAGTQRARLARARVCGRRRDRHARRHGGGLVPAAVAAHVAAPRGTVL